MGDQIIGMEEMEGVFSVTDSFGINREHVSVPLEKADPGSVAPGKGGILEITIPETKPLAEFLDELWHRLEDLGYQAD